MKNCPTCGEPVAMRGNAELPRGEHGWVTHDICPHPCHAKAQAVVEYDVREAVQGRFCHICKTALDVREHEPGCKLAALLASLDTKEAESE